MVRSTRRTLVLAEHKLTCLITVQSRIDEATLLAVQQQMAQQAAFASIPDVVKRVSTLHASREILSVVLTWSIYKVYRPLPPSRSRQQPRRDYCCVREWMEPADGEVLLKDRMAGSRGHRAFGQ